MHFHRDMLATCDSYGRHVLQAAPDDRFIGSPPLAFTFGLGGLVLFPLRIGAATILLEKRAARRAACRDREIPGDGLLHGADRLPRHARASSASTTSRRCAICVSAGETLPKATFEAWHAATGIESLDGIGGHRDAAYLHRLAAGRDPARLDRQAGARLRGANVVDDDGHEVPPGTIGRLAVRGPTGCRYLADRAPDQYVRNGWNITGDTYVHGCGRLFLVPGALRRHDRLGRLQYRGPRGRVRAARASGGGRMRRGRRARSRPRPDREGLCGAAAAAMRAMPRPPRPAGLRQGNALRRTSIRAPSSMSRHCRAPRPASCSASNCARLRRQVPRRWRRKFRWSCAGIAVEDGVVDAL